jgi:hypothetical protein
MLQDASLLTESTNQNLKRLLALVTIATPNVFLLLIQPNPNGLRGGYYEIFTVAPNFALYYSLILATSLGLMALAVIKKSALAGLTAYAVIAPSLFMPRLVNADWLTFIDILHHGAWITVSPVHFAQIHPYDQWPGAWTLWLIVCRVLSLDVIQGSIVMLGADWCLRIVATLVLARLLVRQSGLGAHLSYILGALILVFFQNQYFLINTYSDAALAQSFSILFIYLLLRGRTTSAQVIVLSTLWTVIVITHPFYTLVLGVAAIIFFLGYALHSRKNPPVTLLVLVTISVLWEIYYATQGLQMLWLDFLTATPRSNLLRPQTLQALQPGLQYYGIVFHQVYKFVALPSLALLFIVYLRRGKLPGVNKILIISYLIGVASIIPVFLFVPYFEDRTVTFALLGLTMFAGLQIANLGSGSPRRKIIALALLVLLLPSPYFLPLEFPVYSYSITQSIETSIAFTSHFPSPYFAVFPMDVYLLYSDPYARSLREIGKPPGYATNLTVVSPPVGLTLILTIPPGQLSTNIFQNIGYSPAWNNSDTVYVSGGVQAYYTP